MKKEIYEFIHSNPHVSIHKVADCLNLKEIDVFETINELCNENYVQMDTPVPLSLNNDESSYYSATGKMFREK